MAAPSSGLPAAAAAAAVAASSNVWTAEHDKLFESALAVHDRDSPNRWDEIASKVPGKNAADVKKHYEILVEDVKNIDAGVLIVPNNSVRENAVESPTAVNAAVNAHTVKKVSSSSVYSSVHGHHHHATATSSLNNNNSSSKTSKAQDQERRKGIPWTEEEHRSFLLGLEKFGKGDWRSISRNYVISRTPTQVASHAQKYFIRLNSIHKDKRRTSIHDITSVNGDGRQQSTPITGTSSSSSTALATATATTATAAATNVYPSVGQPVSAAAIGTPVAYASGSHRPVMHMAYPMPQPAMHH